MRWIITACAVAALTACGADGEPVTPTQNAQITITQNGISAGGRVGLKRGPLAVSLGLGL